MCINVNQIYIKKYFEKVMHNVAVERIYHFGFLWGTPVFTARDCKTGSIVAL